MHTGYVERRPGGSPPGDARSVEPHAHGERGRRADGGADESVDDPLESEGHRGGTPGRGADDEEHERGDEHERERVMPHDDQFARETSGANLARSRGRSHPP